MSINFNNKRLVVVIWNLGIGGIQKRVKDIVIELQKTPELEMLLLVKHKRPTPFSKQLERANIKIEYFSNNHQKSNSIQSVFWLFNRLNNFKPTHCLTFLDHLSITLLLYKSLYFFRNCKVILNEGVVTSRFIALNRSFYWHFFIPLYRFANKIIVPTLAVKNNLVKYYKIPSKKISTIPNWTLFKPTNELTFKKYDLIFVSRFEKEKDPLRAIEIIHKIKQKRPNVQLLMIGEGRLLPVINKKINKVNINDNVTVLKSNTRISQYLDQSKILILSSKNEGMPNTILEAGMLSLPVVSTNFIGASEIIKDGVNGYLCENNTQFVQKSLELLSDKGLRLKLGKQLKNDVMQNHSIKTQQKFIEALFLD